jgi:hypothetical protein
VFYSWQYFLVHDFAPQIWAAGRGVHKGVSACEQDYRVETTSIFNLNVEEGNEREEFDQGHTGRLFACSGMFPGLG